MYSVFLTSNKQVGNKIFKLWSDCKCMSFSLWNMFVNVCEHVFVCVCLYMFVYCLYVFIMSCVIVRWGGWLHCVIREPGGCGGGREQSRGAEELNQGFAERARENVGKESLPEIQITYCEPWCWVRLSELLGCFWYFVGLYVCLDWVGELLQIGHSINSSPSRSPHTETK